MLVKIYIAPCSCVVLQQPITLQTLQAGLQNSGSGHILVRTENGQLKLLQLPSQGGAATVATTGTSGAASVTTAAPAAPKVCVCTLSTTV